ncbi:MAG TPA: hypothetical protein VHA06_11540 [Candidatus Angelobacter sp.]|nr:hypothetical protein [Candidatus Angelobacter sp.]
MNSNTSQLVRNSFVRMLAIALVALTTVIGASAQVPATIPPFGINPGQDVGDQGMLVPHGAVRVPVKTAAGVPVLAADGITPLADYWVADTASGFCRIDQAVNPANGFTSGALNLATCFTDATGQPADYQVEFGYVFVADMSIGGVMRFKFIPDATGLHMIIDPANTVAIFNSTSLLGTVAVGIHPRVETCRMGPDGKLYITFPGNGDIWRILNPLSPTFTQAGNKVERVGTSDNARRVDAIAWIGHDLWMDQAGFLNKLQNADKCNYTANCVGLLEFGNITSNLGVASDQRFSTDTTGHHLYFGDGNNVVDYDTATQQTMTIVTNTGNLVSGPLVGGVAPTTPVATSIIQGINLDQATGDFIVVDDTNIEAPLPEAAGPNPGGTGRIWMVKAGVLEPCGPAPTCSMDSQVGNSGPVFTAQEEVAARRATLLLAGVTHPRGLLFLGDRYWVSDEVNGFCRIDENILTGAASLSHCYKPTASFIPGQADATDGATLAGLRTVYVPDASGAAGIARFSFNPANGGTLSQTGVLSSGTSAAESVAIPRQVPGTTVVPEDALYVGFSNNGGISKITKPTTTPSALIPVANLENGVGVISMAFYGGDLYMAEEGTPVLANGNVNSVKRGSFNTYMPKASPFTAKGTAVSVAFPSVRGQELGLVVQNPLAIAIGPEFERPTCLGPPGVATGNILSFTAGDLTTAPSMYVGASAIPTTTTPQSPQGTNTLTQLAEVDQWSITCKTQSTWVNEAALSPLLSLNVPMGSVTAIAVSGHDGLATMAIADDPTAQVPDPKGGLAKDPNGIPLTTPAAIHGQGHIYIVR